MGCLSLSCFTCVYPSCHRPQRWQGWRLSVGRHGFPPAKARTLRCLSPTAQGHVHADQAFGWALAIAHKLYEFSESSLCAPPVRLAPPHQLSCSFDPAVPRRCGGQWGICTSSAALEPLGHLLLGHLLNRKWWIWAHKTNLGCEKCPVVCSPFSWNLVEWLKGKNLNALIYFKQIRKPI